MSDNDRINDAISVLKPKNSHTIVNSVCLTVEWLRKLTLVYDLIKTINLV